MQTAAAAKYDRVHRQNFTKKLKDGFYKAQKNLKGDFAFRKPAVDIRNWNIPLYSPVFSTCSCDITVAKIQGDRIQNGLIPAISAAVAAKDQNTLFFHLGHLFKQADKHIAFVFKTAKTEKEIKQQRNPFFGNR